jgi:anti-sigma factor RsiW
MTCRTLIEFLDAYVDRSLPGEQFATFEEHLRVCRHCREYLDSYRKTIRLGQMAYARFDDEVAGDVPEGLVLAIVAARGRA